MKRTEQKEKRRQEILSTALGMFTCKGYAATRTAEIAKAVGMSEGLLFHYFATKEKLYFNLIDIAISNRESTFKLDNSDPIFFFEKVAEYIIDNCAKDNFVAKLFVLMNQAENNTDLSKEVSENIVGEKQLNESVEIIKKGQVNGSIKCGDPLALALTFWLSIHAIVENMVHNPNHPIPNPKWFADILRNNG